MGISPIGVDPGKDVVTKQLLVPTIIEYDTSQFVIEPLQDLIVGLELFLRFGQGEYISPVGKDETNLLRASGVKPLTFTLTSNTHEIPG